MTTETDKNLNDKPMEKETRSAMQVYNGAIVFLECLLMLVKIIIEIVKATVMKLLPTPEKSVKNEVVLITGCGHGIGKELAYQYASQGAIVVGWDLNLKTCEQTIKEISGVGPKGFAYQCDVTNREQILDLAKQVKKDVGDVTILINNAGIMPCHPLVEHTEREIRNTFEINVLAHFWMLEAFLPSMLEKNYGHIVALSSMAGVGGLNNLVPYCASKFAVRGLMEALSEELRETKPGHNIKFTTICPYMVDTGLCKNPKVRFPSLFPILSPKDVAKFIMKAQRKDIFETTIPSHFLQLNYFMRLFPMSCGRLIKDFVDAGVESDKL